MTRALFASALATAIITLLIYGNEQTGFLPELRILDDIRLLNERLGLPFTTQAAWMTHALIGVILYGVIYAVIQPILPGSAISEGISFGVITWLLMMVVLMPLTGRDLFAQDLGAVFIGATLALHLLYGLVIGVSYDALTSSDG